MSVESERVSRFVIITGMSGSGKSSALKILEDRGFYCIDALPPVIAPSVADVLKDVAAARNTGVAAVADIRCGSLLNGLRWTADELRRLGIDVSIVFLDASDGCIVRRYETTRRRHPMASCVTTVAAVAEERDAMSLIKEESDIVIDTTTLSTASLRRVILSELGLSEEPLSIVVSSFGFKYGVPRDCDYLFDVRFLPNPFFEAELRELSGCDPAVLEYLDKVPAKRSFMEKIGDLFDLLLPQYEISDKKNIHIAFGCTGGRHRSVAVAEEAVAMLRAKGREVWLDHRDVMKEGR